MTVYEMYKEVENTPKWADTTEKIMKSYDKTLKRIEKQHPEIYEDIKRDLYICVNGYHFDERLLKEAYSKMINDNGTKAPKWSVAETTSVANSNGIQFLNFNEYDWNYVMNMIYSDYYDILKDSLMNYIQMANKFLNDKDAPDGKALRYYLAMEY